MHYIRDEQVTRQRVKPGTVRRILPYAMRYRRAIALLLLITAIDSAILAVIPLLPRAIIDDGIMQRRSGVVVALSLAVAGLALVDAVATYIKSRYSAWIGESLVLELRTSVFRHLQRQPLAFFTRTQPTRTQPTRTQPTPAPTTRPPAAAAPRPTATTPVVEFEDVSFRYPPAKEVSLPSLESVTLPAPELPGDAWVLRNVSFLAPAGQMTALVGSSGAGKTTITHLHHETIRANLAYARPEATERELIEACEAARIWDLISSLPNRLDTVVGDRGYRLSGGGEAARRPGPAAAEGAVRRRP